MSRGGAASRRPKIRLFVAADLAADATVEADAAQAHYLGHVMRLCAGDEVALFNGRDGEWRATLGEVGRRRTSLIVDRPVRAQAAGPDLWLLFAPIKRARLDFVAEKATELGVAALVPVLTRRTQASRVNVERLRANAVEAAEQCGRLTVPEVRAPVALDRLLADWPAGRRLMFCDESGAAPPAGAALGGADGGAWAVLIGPEGGFDPDERAAVREKAEAMAVGLGPRTLRAETAVVAALTLWQAHLGDWR